MEYISEPGTLRELRHFKAIIKQHVLKLKLSKKSHTLILNRDARLLTTTIITSHDLLTKTVIGDLIKIYRITVNLPFRLAGAGFDVIVFYGQ